MKHFPLFVLCFLSLSGLHAKDITDTGNNCMGKAPFQQKEQKASDTSAAESTITLLVNMANNSLTSWNNQITFQSITLTAFSVILTGIGIFAASKIKRLEKRYLRFEKNEESQRQKNEIMANYIGRLNDLLLKVSMEINNGNAGTLLNSEQDDSMNNVYVGYYLIRLSVINVPIKKGQGEEKQKALQEIEQATYQIVEKGGLEDLKVLQEMAEFETNKIKKKMLKKAAKELQDRLINHV